jgi:hypothetical protein
MSKKRETQDHGGKQEEIISEETSGLSQEATGESTPSEQDTKAPIDQELRRDDEKEVEKQRVLKMGDTIFFRHIDAVNIGWLTSDPQDNFADIVYVDSKTGRTGPVTRCVRGTKTRNWWHDSQELKAAIEFERQCKKAGIAS